MRDFRHDPIVCPRCGYQMDGSLSLKGDEAPDPGDVSVCIDCAGVAVYGNGLRLRLPTRAEAEEIGNDPEVLRAVATVLRLQR